MFIQIRPKAPQASVMGYYYTGAGGHYFVVKGCYYNSAEGRYDSVVNETHHKFGMDSAKGFYWSDTHTHPKTKAPGGRDLVLPAEMLHTIYMQRYCGMLFKA